MIDKIKSPTTAESSKAKTKNYVNNIIPNYSKQNKVFVKNPYLFKEVISSVSLKSVMEQNGTTFIRNKCLCMFHNDRNPSMSIKNERYKCFSCGESGDVIDFIAKLYGYTPIQAVKYIIETQGLNIDMGGYQPDKEKQEADRKALEEKERKERAEKKVNDWINAMYRELCSVYRAFTDIKQDICDIEDIDDITDKQVYVLQNYDYIEYLLDELQWQYMYTDKWEYDYKKKAELYKNRQEMERLCQNYKNAIA